MKKLMLLFLTLFLGVTSIFSNDILTLNNQMVFKGKFKAIKGCDVIFKAEKKKYIIPITDVYSMQFANVKDKVYLKYLKNIKNDPEACKKGIQDAPLHGKEFGHIALGFLFGPFAILGTAMSTPTPNKGIETQGMSENQDLFNNPAYLECYEKKVKNNLIMKELTGWGISVAVSLISSVILAQ